MENKNEYEQEIKMNQENTSKEEVITNLENQVEPETSKKQVKTEKRFSLMITTALLVGTLVVSLVVGYFVTTKFFVKSEAERQLQLNLEKYTKLVNKKPNDPNYRVQLGYVYLQLKDTDKAISEYKTALGIDKKYYPAILNLAIAYYGMNDTSNAINYATRAEKMNSSDFEPMFIKGSCLRKLKKYKEAKEELEKAQKIAPDKVQVIYEIGLLAENKGDKAEAKKIYKQALSFDPTYQDAIKGLERVKK